MLFIAMCLYKIVYNIGLLHFSVFNGCGMVHDKVTVVPIYTCDEGPSSFLYEYFVLWSKSISTWNCAPRTQSVMVSFLLAERWEVTVWNSASWFSGKVVIPSMTAV
jgi:hypothetical protein